MKIKYVGLKEEETAFSPESGIVWNPGSSHEVPDGLARRMLAHPDVFAVDEGKRAPAKTETTPPPPPAPPEQRATPPKGEFVISAPDGPLVLDGLERDVLWNLANEAGLKPHVNLGIPKLQALLMERFPFKAD